MNPALLALGVAVTLAAVLAVSARDPRLATVGLVAALAGAPLVTEPFSAPLAIGARIVAAALAGYLIRVALRRAPLGRGSRLGWPAELAIGAAAFAVGLGAVGAAGTVVAGPATAVALDAATGPAPAVAAGFALIALAVAPLAEVRDVLRLGIGAALLLTGADLVWIGLAGSSTALDDLAVAGLVVGLGATVAILIVRTAGSPDGGVGGHGHRVSEG